MLLTALSAFDIIVNIQGDEPFINPSIVNQIIDNFIIKNTACFTICFKTTNRDEIKSKSRGKVVTDNSNNILYCSRNVIPTNKNENIISNHKYNIHVGIFVYDKNYLLNHFCQKNTPNQLLEDIEWLKIMEQGFKIIPLYFLFFFHFNPTFFEILFIYFILNKKIDLFY